MKFNREEMDNAAVEFMLANVKDYDTPDNLLNARFVAAVIDTLCYRISVEITEEKEAINYAEDIGKLLVCRMKQVFKELRKQAAKAAKSGVKH